VEDIYEVAACTVRDGDEMGGLGVGPFAAAVWIVWTKGPDEEEFTWTGLFPTVNLSLPRSDYFGLQ
jgi:hypothetical protein